MLLALALILLLLGWLSLRQAATVRRKTGLPEGRLVYVDHHRRDWQPNDKPFYSATYRLVGKPDYLVETLHGVIPVEVKSGAAPDVPYLGHLLQLAAYCLLIEDTTGRQPPHGWLRYADALFEVGYAPELRTELLDTLTAIRRDRQVNNVSRSHDQVNKCRACGLNYACDEALY
ncbi:MAG: Dna2/Cas4 domain-containing protein [Anaerolineae bacterium]|nr:Dna2/Cas4 domain-containing protein [Anaerolineae bacterium]MCB9103403.1 Dna2/Cas4 domain-containing protein [Anaerolineales bacterium]